MILLWGLPDEAPIRMVHAALRRSGLRAAFLDQRAVLDTEIELSVGSRIEGIVRCRDQTVDLGAVTAVYLRPYDSRRLPGIRGAGQDSAGWRHALAVEDALWTWVELTPALVVNRPSAQATNNSKPYQATRIRSVGFETPDTLITTDPSAVREFWATHGAVIYKSISGVRSIVSRLGPEHVRRLDNVSRCPTQFQQYVPGTDHRVHVVGDEVFASEIVSQATDYRYAAQQEADVEIRACEISEACAERCRELASSLELVFAGIDLRRTPDGEWYCFEVNPSPGYTYYQEASDQPIDEAIARLLAAGVHKPNQAMPHLERL